MEKILYDQRMMHERRHSERRDFTPQKVAFERRMYERRMATGRRAAERTPTQDYFPSTAAHPRFIQMFMK